MFESLTTKQKRALMQKFFGASSRCFRKASLRFDLMEPDDGIYATGSEIDDLANDLYHSIYKA